MTQLPSRHVRANRQNSDGGRCSAELRTRRPAEYPNCEASPSLELIAEGLRAQYGPVYADRWLRDQLTTFEPVQEPILEHPSHTATTELLEPHREALGAAYPLLHFLARWSLENATEDDPAPHLMTTYWTLEEVVGKSERMLRRYLVEPGNPWSEAVRHFVHLVLPLLLTVLSTSNLKLKDNSFQERKGRKDGIFEVFKRGI